MSVLKCKMCGGSLEIQSGDCIATCQYCGTMQTLPQIVNANQIDNYNRINDLRQNNQYDAALALCEKTSLAEEKDAELYWNTVLCKYGVEYVEDPTSKKHIPTINRMQFDSILKDDDYLTALKLADEQQKAIYQKQAEEIYAIQKSTLEIIKKEKPFDVFICYKETDENGKRTQDSVIANDLYHQLTKEGFKVFFAKITLEDKLGSAYEPYIFAALNSAKVMVVIGTKPEYFNAVWVRNEWSRFLHLAKDNPNKVLIPAYRDMDPYDLPEEFVHLQAQDMSKLGFMLDLTRGIQKILKKSKKKIFVPLLIGLLSLIVAALAFWGVTNLKGLNASEDSNITTNDVDNQPQMSPTNNSTNSSISATTSATNNQTPSVTTTISETNNQTSSATTASNSLGTPIPVDEVRVYDEGIGVVLGQTLSLSPNYGIRPKDATDKSLTFKSSDPSIVTVDQQGNVTAKAVGTAQITLTSSNGISNSINVNVMDIKYPSVPIVINEGKKSLKLTSVEVKPNDVSNGIIEITIESERISGTASFFDFKVTLIGPNNNSIRKSVWLQNLPTQVGGKNKQTVTLCYLNDWGVSTWEPGEYTLVFEEEN